MVRDRRAGRGKGGPRQTKSEFPNTRGGVDKELRKVERTTGCGYDETVVRLNVLLRCRTRVSPLGKCIVFYL